MDDAELRREYKLTYDKISASDELREKILNQKPQKRSVSPLKATIGTIAAAFMIFAAVHEYGFKENTDGVISETVVSTQIPYAEFRGTDDASETEKPKPTAQTDKKTAATAHAVATAKAPSVKPTEKTVVKNEPDTVSEDEEVAPQNEPAAYSVSTARMGDTPLVVTENWDIDRYYNYIGVNIASRIGGTYTGSQTIELDVDENGTPTDDTVVLSYACRGGQVRITVSKGPLFDASLNGSVSEAGSGYNAYKLSNGIYYFVNTTNLAEDDVVAIINSL